MDGRETGELGVRLAERENDRNTGSDNLGSSVSAGLGPGGVSTGSDAASRFVAYASPYLFWTTVLGLSLGLFLLQ